VTAIASLLALGAAATPGEWSVKHNPSDRSLGEFWRTAECGGATDTSGDTVYVVAPIMDYCTPAEADAAFIAAACNFIRSSEFAALVADAEALRAFALDVLEDFHLGDLDGGDRQDLAVKHGLLRSVEMTEPCGESCVCAEYGDFPMDCFRKTTRLTGKPGSDATLDPGTARSPQ
jgi:hypothetical protein